MTLRKKTLVFIAVIFIFMIAILYLCANIFLLQSYADLESDAISANTEQALGALSSEIDALSAFNYDWAAWDDTYAFIEDANEDFIESNLVDETFIGAQLNLMAFINPAGQVVFAKAFDLEEEEEISVPQSFMEQISSETLLLSHPDTESSIEGLIMLPENPMLISSRPVITSKDEGPVKGSLIFGRYLDSSQIDELAEITHLSLSIHLPDDPLSTSDLKTAILSLSAETPIFTQPLDGNRIAGYGLINDIYGQPGLILKTDIPRDIYQKGLTTVDFFVLSFLVIGLILAVTLSFTMNKLVLSPLLWLSQEVRNIGKSNSFSARVSTKGSGEFVRLEEDINRMLEDLEQVHDELKRILSTIPNAVLVIDKDLRILLANRAFSEAFKLEYNAVKNKSVNDVIKAEGLPEAISEVQAGRQPEFELEFRYNIDGIERIILAGVIQMGEGEVLLIMRDVTDERARMETLYLTDRLASVGEMASGIAHELNNPLTGAIGFTQLLMEKDLPEDIRSDIEVINRETQRAAEVVKNLLAFARKHTATKQMTQLNNTIKEILELRVYEHKLNNIKVDLQLDPELPEVMVDCHQMQQVFLNLILNAESAMAEAGNGGGLNISTERGNNNIKLSFADNGPGILKENLTRIFDPFFTTKEVGKGTGLGLSICHGIVLRHGGKIYAKSKPGKGSTIIIELPVDAN